MKLRYRFLAWLLRRRYNWSPFEKDGSVDWARLEKEGWHQTGAIVADGRPTVSNKAWLRPAEAALVEAEAESEVHEPWTCSYCHKVTS